MRLTGGYRLTQISNGIEVELLCIGVQQIYFQIQQKYGIYAVSMELPFQDLLFRRSDVKLRFLHWNLLGRSMSNQPRISLDLSDLFQILGNDWDPWETARNGNICALLIHSNTLSTCFTVKPDWLYFYWAFGEFPPGNVEVMQLQFLLQSPWGIPTWEFWSYATSISSTKSLGDSHLGILKLCNFNWNGIIYFNFANFQMDMSYIIAHCSETVRVPITKFTGKLVYIIRYLWHELEEK